MNLGPANGAAVGKITATPNPISSEAVPRTTIAWETSDLSGGEVYVTRPGEAEQLVSRGQSGSVDVDWIQPRAAYLFRLFTSSEPRQVLDEVTVRRTEALPFGKITATPNPIPFDALARTTIAWETSDLSGGEVWVSKSEEDEQLVGEGPSGSVYIDWIQPGVAPVFRLFTSSEPRRVLDEVIVRRTDVPWDAVLNHLGAGAIWDKEQVQHIGRLVANIIPACINHADFSQLFHLWEEHGFHITPVHFYQPIPDTRTVDEQATPRASNLVGVSMNDAVQLDLLRTIFPQFQEEYHHIPSAGCGPRDAFSLGNDLFGGTDALVAYCMVRRYQPQLIIEVGSGYSSLILAQALARSAAGSLICIEPFPPDFLAIDLPHLSSLVRRKVEEVELDFFSQLQAGDILFIDSSHTVKIGGDVNYLFLEVIPRLNPGVIVHVHDISFPFDYRSDWVKNGLRFWTEQYLLQAFLAFNSDFEVLICNSYLASRYLEDLKVTFPRSPWWGGGSFWMQRKAQG